ncbi:MAG: phosphomethylpyrimidine synthase ThiC [Candidatus Altiarchaeota archaeon]
MDHIRQVLAGEPIGQRKLELGLKAGSIVLVRNSRRRIKPIAIGAGVTTKVNANVGTSPGKFSLKDELAKVDTAVRAGADTLMDLSVEGGLDRIRREIITHSRIPFGTVPIYQAFRESGLDLTLDGFLKVLEKHCRDGVDFVTIHAGITRDLLLHIEKRIIPVTSRGGSFLAAWMRHNRKENFLYTGYESVLEILREYDVTISLGDALRPGAVHDATDKGQLGELRNLGKLTKKARAENVKVIVEGPGHVSLNQIEKNIRLQKRICGNAPFYVLGPLVTDIGLGHDHITSAIGGAVAAAAGADFLCYVTPSEHLGLPTLEDVHNGVIASKIAAHAGDIVKLGLREQDDKMSKARRTLDWERMFKLALDSSVRDKYPKLKKNDACTMCGEYCALKVMGK